MEPPAYNGIMSSFDYLENCNRRIFNHGWVNFPLAYTQVIQVSLFILRGHPLMISDFLGPFLTYLPTHSLPGLNPFLVLLDR